MRHRASVIVLRARTQSVPHKAFKRTGEVLITGFCILAAAFAFMELWFLSGPFHALWMSFVASALITTTSLLFAGHRAWSLSRSMVFIAALAICGAAFWNILPANL